jgi:trimethylamine--corrinoid protein Co-methyltransferase
MVASIVLVQMAHPGAPTYHSLMPGIMHPYTGNFDGGARETGIFYPVGVELAHNWGVPTLAGVGTSADTSGWSSAVGIASNMLMVALCGAETCSGIGLRETCTLLTPEALVLDADIYDTVRVDARGVDTSQEAFALNVIKNVGPRGHFLKEKHTRQHLRKMEFSELTTQLSNEGGYKDPIDMALEKTAWILENHYPEPLSEAQRGELKSILSSAEREIK